MATPISNNAQGQNPARPRNESNVKIKFSKELLTELQNNTFSGRCEEDVIVHIGKVLEILDLIKIADFENEFPAIVYNDALTSKSDLLNEPTISPRHIDEFDLKDETSLAECDEEEQNVLYFNDLFPFNVIYPDDLKLDTDNDNDKIDIEQPSRDMSSYHHLM
ncbi:hypothetical protein Tco_1028568 [Tanacetum coccineum]|uniref:Reverse transcriptase domain-containing protein n=1 Tax=Tanacetum coccineum TaxID=301880 RepID=A0ABQ5G2R6_9ASTR